MDPRSAVPPFEQIRVQVLALIRQGQLEPETRLPTVRKLAADLGLAPNTVARAYRELELNGAIETRGRHGTFVSGHDDPIQRQAQKAAEEYAGHIRALGLGHSEAAAFLDTAFGAGAKAP
ncbi:DNA-binding transcriptional regulator YhcF (GntR family) [Arthrobacter stackebrandtii]|uniref:DNA-binding transcriptional regulator YhcF (GntR family) n=1 Tax=Arthrobacter stackebrandtii TaxID=272161 RepID=A0ABS4Z0L3_9MICC|nr:DNA-binding transcriptional regulator YhcF (GntR family) [Arthrobacter stackebrandtii]